ncbi:MAG: hypothetical protein ACFFG0_35080 [Candidatus Thorarchaeota archaeon]
MKTNKLSFALYENGRIICKSHTKFFLLKEKIEGPSFQKMIKERLKVNSCKYCDHYINNSCMVSKNDLNRYMLKLKLKRYKCEFCGHSIESLYNAIFKSAIERQYNIKIPFLCCSCFNIFQKDNIIEAETARKKNFEHFCLGELAILIPLISIPFLVSWFFNILNFMLILLIPIIVIVIINVIFEFKSTKKLKKSLKKSKILNELNYAFEKNEDEV